MKKLMIISSLIFIFYAYNLQARLYENSDKCKERYGTPKKEGKEGDFVTRYYFKNGLSILIVFYNDKAIQINYARPNQDDSFYKRRLEFTKKDWTDTITTPNEILNLNLPLTDKEVEHLRKINLEGSKWSKENPNVWISEKKTVRASYSPARYILTVEVLKVDEKKQDSGSQLEGL